MIIVKTPLRISFVGGGSDLFAYYSKAEGQVISATIDKYVYIIIKKRFDDNIYINYSKKECVEEVNQIKHDLVREAMKKTGVNLELKSQHSQIFHLPDRDLEVQVL